ncbi:MAG: TolC family protein [Hasllibacter sp.]
MITSLERRARRALRRAALGAVLMLAACAPAGPPPAPAAYAFAPGWQGGAGGPALRDPRWWTRLGDPVLDRLVAAALASATDVAVARARLAEADAAIRAIPLAAAVAPELRATARAGEGGGSSAGGTLALEWLLDPWGGRAARVRAAAARAAGARAAVDGARLAVVSRLALAYVELRHLQAFEGLRRADLAGARRLAAAAAGRREAGQGTRLALVRARARAAEIEATLPDLRAAQAARLQEIAQLIGAPAGPLPPAAVPVPRLPPDPGIPAELVRNRPDIRAAEAELRAAWSLIRVAEAERLPSLSLTGTVSVTAGAGEGVRLALGPVLRLPSLPGGPADARLEGRRAAAAAALALWQAAVRGALAEVETALAAHAAAARTHEAAIRARALRREALALTEELLAEGAGTVDAVLEARRDLTAAETALAAARRDRAAQYVRLSVALGSVPGEG